MVILDIMKKNLNEVTEGGALTGQSVDANWLAPGKAMHIRQGKWMDGWKAKGWKTAAKKPVKNQDLWERMDLELQRHAVTWHWVKGHAGHPENERADQLATSAIKR